MTQDLPTPEELLAHLHIKYTLRRELAAKTDPTDKEQMLERFRITRELRQRTEQTLKAQEQEAAENALAAGATWADLGATSGITRQTAQQTYRLQSKKPQLLEVPEVLEYVDDMPDYPTPRDRENLPIYLAQMLWAWYDQAEMNRNVPLRALWGDIADVVEHLAGGIEELAMGGDAHL